jgi:bifunctional DNase/RNase
MTGVRIVHVEPWPGRLREAGFAISQFLVLLADDAGRRALPVWLNGVDGDPLWRILGQQDDGAGMAGTAEELTGRLLEAAGVAVTGVDIGDLNSETAEPPRPGPASRPLTEARIALGAPGGTRHVAARLGFSLALAAAAGAPVRVAGGVLDRLAVAIQDGDLVRQFTDGLPAPAPAVARSRPRLRFEPRNLTFADGLDRWEFGGSFRAGAGASPGDDYSCTAQGRSAVIRSAVPEPNGFAGLQQTMAADDYRGRTVVFSGELRTEDVAGRAGLHLTVGPPLGPAPTRRSPPERTTVAVTGSQDWTRHEVAADVPGEAGIVGFGFFLAGRGLVELRNAELTSGPDSRRPDPGH